MFNESGAELLCAKQNIEPGYAVTSGVGAHLNSAIPKTARTITARDVAFPLRDPYSPVSRARVPVPGYNAWPQQPRLGRRYYGLSGPATRETERAKVSLSKQFAKPRGFAGLGAFEPGWEDPYSLGLPPARGTTTNPRLPTGSGGIDWGAIFGGAIASAPGIIQAVRGNPVTQPAYYPQQQQPQYYPQGVALPTIAPGSLATSGALAGEGISNLSASVSNFVTQNPLIVLGGGLALVLLFTRPPSRR